MHASADLIINPSGYMNRPWECTAVSARNCVQVSLVKYEQTMEMHCWVSTRTCVQVSLEIARLWCFCKKSHHSLTKGQRFSLKSSCHIPTAVSKCTHFCPFCRWTSKKVGKNMGRDHSQ